MAKASGGTRGGGASARGGGGITTVFTGNWSGNTAGTSTIQIYGINKETAKAINVKTAVEWGEGSAHIKDIWVPKSTITTITKDKSGGMTLKMKKSMVQSISKQNTYKGYEMEFTFSDNT